MATPKVIGDPVACGPRNGEDWRYKVTVEDDDGQRDEFPVSVADSVYIGGAPVEWVKERFEEIQLSNDRPVFEQLRKRQEDDGGAIIIRRPTE